MSSYTEEKSQIRILNELYKMNNQTKVKGKTIALFDLYKDAKEDELSLHNLHTFAQVLLDPTLKVQVNTDFDEEASTMLTRYSVDADEVAKKQIISQKFEIENENQGPGLNNIWFYEVKDGDTRIVVIPIHSEMIDISAIKEETQKDEEQNAQFEKKIKSSGAQGQAMEKKRKERQIQKKEKLHARCIKAAEKHLKMFKIQAFLGTVLQKTEKISLCSLVQICDRRHRTIEAYQRQFDNLFMVPNEFKPQYILHGLSDKRQKTRIEANKEAVTTVFTNNKEIFGVDKFTAHEDCYFFPTENIRTKIYENIQKNKTEAFSAVINDFVNNWSKIFMNAALSFSTIVKEVSSLMYDPERNVNDANVSMEESLTDIPMTTFEECFEEYMINDLELPTKQTLGSFLDKDSSMQAIKKGEKSDEKVPIAIEPLLFIHFFSKIQRESNALLVSEIKSDSDKILPYWKNILRDIYELINDIKETTLEEQRYQKLRCPNLQKFYDFLTFAFESLVQIRKITNRPLSTTNELKGRFEQMKIRKEKIVTYILNNQNKIRSDQPVYYYNIMIKIVTHNSSPEMLRDLQYVILHIHEEKAIRIAKSFIHDYNKITEAVKSLALIGQKYHNLLDHKKKQIDIQKIESIMARLLKIIGQEELAGDIYIKNRQYDLAHKSYQMAFVRLTVTNDEKAEKLIVWGNHFLKGFEYDLALHYYRRAYTCAARKSLKQEAVKTKFLCLEKMRQQPDEADVRLHNQFKEDGDVIGYTNNDKQTLDKMVRLFRQIRICLEWQSEKECAVLLDRDLDVEDQDSSFYKYMKSQIVQE